MKASQTSTSTVRHYFATHDDLLLFAAQEMSRRVGDRVRALYDDPLHPDDATADPVDAAGRMERARRVLEQLLPMDAERTDRRSPMNVLAFAPLAGLALVDSTSFGTLGVPVFLMARARLQVRALLGYLATIASFYWLVGLVLVLGAGHLQRLLAGVGDSRPLTWVQLVVGVALFAVSWLFDGKRAAAHRSSGKRRARRVDRLPRIAGSAGRTPWSVIARRRPSSSGWPWRPGSSRSPRCCPTSGRSG